MTLYLKVIQYRRTTGEFAEMELVDYYAGRPVYMDTETGEIYCPIKEGWQVAPPLEGTAEYGLWTRIARYIAEVLQRIVS